MRQGGSICSVQVALCGAFPSPSVAVTAGQCRRPPHRRLPAGTSVPPTANNVLGYVAQFGNHSAAAGASAGAPAPAVVRSMDITSNEGVTGVTGVLRCTMQRCALSAMGCC